MYVIVEIAGLQYKVKQDQHLFVNYLGGEIDDVVTFDRVLLSDNGAVIVGAPVIEGMVVTAKILDIVKGDKVIVFKKKRRKGYKVKNGHRQIMSKILITSIGAGSNSENSNNEDNKTIKEEKIAEQKEENLNNENQNIELDIKENISIENETKLDDN